MAMEHEKDSSKVDREASKGQTAAVQAMVGEMAGKGGHRLQENAEKVGHKAREIATKVVHSAQETAQKVVDRAKETATVLRHRREELASKTADKPKGS